MTSPSPDLRFGIRVGTKRSYLVGSLSDGTLALVDGRFDSAAVDALASLRDQFQQPPPTLD